MMSTSRNWRLGRASNASVDFAPTRVARVTANAPGGSTLDRLLGRERDRERRATADALAQERRRIAADVHDLIMQDLALALATARALADDPARATLASTVIAASERALAGAHQIVSDLTARARQPVVEAVEDSVRTAARRLPLSFHASGVPAGVQPDQPTLDTLVHIGREAVTNAVKHATPPAIAVVLEYGEEWRLQVRDDGCGFDTSDVSPGFGLESMTRQAHELGGSLHLSSAPGAGTTVEAILP
jgi:signal transduction histidine kinase